MPFKFFIETTYFALLILSNTGAIQRRPTSFFCQAFPQALSHQQQQQQQQTRRTINHTSTISENKRGFMMKNNDTNDQEKMDQTIDEIMKNFSPSENSSSSYYRPLSELNALERLEIVQELMTVLIATTKDNSSPTSSSDVCRNWFENELRLTGFLNEKESEGDDADMKTGVKYTSNMKKSMSQFNYAFVTQVMANLQSFEQSLQYQSQIHTNSNNDDDKEHTPIKDIPTFLKKTRVEKTNEGDVTVHGPFRIPLPQLRFELWTRPSSIDDDEEMTLFSNGKTSHDIQDDEEGVTVILGAGNQSFLSILDLLHCIFVYPQKPVILKHHPLRPFLYDLYATLLEPLISRGYVHQIYDEGIEFSEALLRRGEVKHIHITGALSTVNAIKKTIIGSPSSSFGSDIITEDEAERMITSELGCATPWILSPGTYTKSELSSAAKGIVSAKKQNSGCNCLCAQVIVLPEGWQQKHQFRKILKKEMDNTLTDPTYYPNSLERCNDLANPYRSGSSSDNSNTLNTENRAMLEEGTFAVPEQNRNQHITMVECGVHGTDEYDGHAVTNEAFGPLLAIVEIPGDASSKNAESYLLDNAIPFVNDKNNIFGSLSCSILFPNALQKNKELKTKVISSLKYGCIGVNTWTFYGYMALTMGGVWGAHPRDLTGQSGRGQIGNQFLVSNAEKTVVYGPSLRQFPLLQRKLLSLAPPIGWDVMSKISLSKSKAGAVGGVCGLLFTRCISFCWPFSTECERQG